MPTGKGLSLLSSHFSPYAKYNVPRQDDHCPDFVWMPVGHDLEAWRKFHTLDVDARFCRVSVHGGYFGIA